MTVKVTIEPDEFQTFRGAGFSVAAEGDPWRSGLASAAFNALSFRELNASIVRWWWGDGSVDKLANRYVEPGTMRIAREQGVGTFLLAPAANYAPGAWKDGNRLNNTGAREHPKVVADLIAGMRDRHGITFEATGQINEPGSGGRVGVLTTEYVNLAKNFRRELDARGLQDVKLVGLEWQPPIGSTHVQYADAIARDPEASAAISGPASHTYDASPTEEVVQISRELGWEYWQTECGGNSHRSQGAAKFLSDLNHAVTRWVHFIGPGTGLSGHVLTAPPDLTSANYWAMKILWNVFVAGTRIRRCSSDAGSRMRWNRHAEVLTVYAAAGVDPAGRWIVGMANPSGNPDNEWVDHPPAEDVEVEVVFPEPINATFAVVRTRDGQGGKIEVGEQLHVVAGVGRLTLRSREVAALVEADAARDDDDDGGENGSGPLEEIIDDLEGAIAKLRSLGPQAPSNAEAIGLLEEASATLGEAQGRMSSAATIVEAAIEKMRGQE